MTEEEFIASVQRLTDLMRIDPLACQTLAAAAVCLPLLLYDLKEQRAPPPHIVLFLTHLSEEVKTLCE